VGVGIGSLHKGQNNLTTQDWKEKPRQPSKVGKARTGHGIPMKHADESAGKLATDVDEPSSV
jgi:hypothetical protein